jgi:uncharacterized membrane protein
MGRLAPDAERTTSQVPAYFMGAMLLGSGTAHLVIPAKFDWMVPVELAGGQRFYTYGSGVAEIAVGALLLAPQNRLFGATAAVALFVGLFPANLNGVRLWWHKPWWMRLVPILRLPMQIPLITTALKIRRNALSRSD